MSKSEKPNDKQSSTDDQPVLALDSPSQLRISRFEVIKRIGKGGMGEVYLCRDPGANGVTTPYVALKTIFRDALKDAESISRFEAEARALEGLNHANIVHLVEWGKQQGGHADGMYYMAMEYIDGTTIHSLSRSHRLSFPDILDISIQLANGLSATHATGVIHRDIKPANVMVNKKNVAKLIDFGIAKPTVQEFGLDLGDGFTEDQDFKTKTGIVIGTANYLAPELLRSSSQNAASPLSDIYALGVLIWEMLNATTPFKASSFGETMHRILEENLAWPDAITDIAPHGFIRLVNRMLSKDPSKRPQSAKQIADELIEIQKAATWSAIFDRRSRVDIRLRWSKTTKEQLLQYGLHPSEFGFVLQQIEDGLIAVDDERLKSQDSIDIEPEVLAIAVEAYFAAKKEASRIRQQRLKSEIALGGVRPAKPSQATEIVIPSARPPITDSTLRLKHLLMGIGLVSSIALAIFTLNREKKPAPSLTSKPQHSTSLSSLGTKPNPSTPEVASPPTQAPPPVPKRDPTTTQSWIFKPGTLLTYSVTTTNQGGHSQTVEQKREIWAITPLRITWFVDGRIRLFSSRAFFANEIFFSSTLPNPGTPVEEPFDFHPVRLRHTVQYTIADQKTQSSDSVKCTPIRREYEQHPTLGSLNAWDIQCLRTVTIQGQVTHLITETYRYSPDGDFVLSAQQKNERITHDGKTVIVGYREMKLDNRRSRFER